MNNSFDLVVIGSGAAGMMAAITAAREGKKVALLEKLTKLGVKLKATGGGRCNLTNTLSLEDFMNSFGRNGKFMFHALREFDHQHLRDFFEELGVKTHAPDGFRIFPKTHNSLTILKALEEELKRLGIEIFLNEKVIEITKEKKIITEHSIFFAHNIVIATGGLGYPQLGADSSGYTLAAKLQHKITDLYPAMTPLLVKERWVEHCRADTIAKAILQVNLPKHKKIKAVGDLIFTKNGIRGPLVLDISRDLTPLVKKYGEVPILLSLSKKNQEEVFLQFKKEPNLSILEVIKKFLPTPLALELIKEVNGDKEETFKKQKGVVKEKLVEILAWTPLTITGTEEFKTAMVTRGGVSLKEINPNTLESKIIKGVYFCGEILDLDGPCGGYNLQFSFSSGYLAGKLLKG